MQTIRVHVNEDRDILTIQLNLMLFYILFSIKWEDEFVLIPYVEELTHTNIWNWLNFAWTFDIITIE